MAKYQYTKYAGLSDVERKAAYDKARRENRLKWLADLKDRPCEDCGNKYPQKAMDWHHLDGNGNRFNFRTAKKALVLEEIKKCVLLCAVCHRLRH
jgi:hypothetical protein